jgi:dsRNA-specific ribonuclease
MDAPPLPKIESGELMLEVFTHESLQSDQSGKPTDEDYGGSERLAELGQRVLDMAVTSSLFSIRPMLGAPDIAVS